MSVKVRPYRGSEAWEVDITVRLPSGKEYRERKKAQVSSKSKARRWAEERERHLLQHGPQQHRKEAPTLKEFSPRFLEGHPRANRHKASGIAAKEMILRVHLIPALGNRRLDAITNEDVQRVKTGLAAKALKTVNNVLTVLSVLLSKAVEWGAIDQKPCSIKLLPVSPGSIRFYDFDEYERLVEAARLLDSRTHLIVLLGGEVGLRCGEMMALEWADVDVPNRRLCVRQSDWNGHVDRPKNGRIRHVPLTRRTATALGSYRHLRSPRVLCQDDNRPFTRQIVQTRAKRAARKAGLQQVRAPLGK